MLELSKMLKTAAIQKAITCPITGAVLDIKTAKFLVDKDGDPMYAMSPEAFDAVVSGLETERGRMIVEALNAKGLYLPKEETND